MGMGRNKIAEVKRALPAGIDQDALVERRVARCRHHPDSLHDIALAEHQLQLSRRFDREIIAIEVARRRPLVGMKRVVPLASLHEVSRSEERRVGKECRYRWAPDAEKNNK